MKIIKRYTNRKLYDTVESRYVTLEEIAEMIRAGGDVRIIDNRTKEDLTSVTLAQIIFEQEKKKARMPLDMLKGMVRSGGDTLQGFISREIQPRVDAIREEAEHRIPRLFRKGHEGQDPKAMAEEMLSQLKANVEEWQAWIDGRVHDATSAVNLPALQAELERLRTRVEEMRLKVVAGRGEADKGGKGEETAKKGE
ncbi:MAG: polyhydroxyalkanoate synthesis regulator DNA-binding domain-containing protein [Deltaproteobacteria bacterium]|nr:polyhydroxyalkanoate synthesis regulator DNA-binding domain-containing protein [Deltaproteobacteria bacterium]